MNNNPYDIGDLLQDDPIALAMMESVPSFPDFAAGDGVAPSALGSGEFGGNMTIQDGFLRSSNFVTGTSGWELTPTSAEFNVGVSVDELHIPDETTANSFHVETDGDAWWGCNVADWGLAISNANAYVLKDGTAKFNDITLAENVVISGLQSGTDIALLEHTHDLTFDSISNTEIQWSAGTIKLSNDVVYNINGYIENTITGVRVSDTEFISEIRGMPRVSCVLLDSSHVVVSYADPGDDIATVYSFDANGRNLTPVSTFVYALHARGASWGRIDDTHLAVAFASSHSSESYNWFLKTFSVDGSYNGTEIDSLTVAVGSVGSDSLSLIVLDSTHLLVAGSEANGGTAFIRTYSIDGSADNITEIDELAFSAAIERPKVIQMDATHFAFSYLDKTNDLVTTKTFSIDGLYDNITVIDTFSTAKRCFTHSIELIDSTHFIVFHGSWDPVTDGYLSAKTFSVDGSYDNITEIDSATLGDSVYYEGSDSRVMAIKTVSLGDNNFAVACDFDTYLSGQQWNEPGYITTLKVDGSYNIAVYGSKLFLEGAVDNTGNVVTVRSIDFIKLLDNRLLCAWSLADYTTTPESYNTRLQSITYSTRGSTGPLTAGSVLYFDRNVSETDLQVSENPSDAVGSNTILIGRAVNTADSGGSASFVPARGLGGNTVNEEQIKVSSLAALSSTPGELTLTTSSHIKAGQTAYNTGTGFWAGYDTTAYKFSLGTATGQQIKWDGTDLNINAKLQGEVVGGMKIDATPNTDHTANGATTDTINAGATIAQFELCYLASDGEWALADADATATTNKLLALALAAGTDGNAMLVALRGSVIRDDTWTWTVGDPIYVSATAGGLTQTAPSTTGQYKRVIGYALSATAIFFDPEKGEVVP